MTETTNLKLKKPDVTDFYNIGDFNENADKIDEAVKDLQENKTNDKEFTSHTGNKENPHGVTKLQVGLNNVPNVATNDQTPTFSVASTRDNIVSGEKLSVIMGKIMKFFSDLKDHAFEDIVNNLTTSTTGSALDASQGKVLKDEVDEINSNLDNQGLLNKVTEMQQGRWNISSGVFEDGKYYVSSKESISCNGNSNIKLKCDNAEAFDIVFFNGSSFISGESKNGSELLFTIPSNATSFKFNIYNGNQLTPQNIGKIEVYVDNQIEQLKNEVSAQNESLEDYGLNAIPTDLENGFISESGEFADSNSNARDKLFRSCNANDSITVISQTICYWIGIACYKEDGAFLSLVKTENGNHTKATLTTPTDTAKYKVVLSFYSNMTPSQIGRVVSYVNNAIDELKNDLSESKSKLDNISIDTIDRELGEITLKGIDFAAELTLLKIGNQLELLRGKIFTVGSYFSVTSGDVLSFVLSESEFGDYINGLKTTAKLAFSAQGIFDSKVIGMINIGNYTSSSGDKGFEVMLRFNASYDFSSENVKSGIVQFDF